MNATESRASREYRYTELVTEPFRLDEDGCLRVPTAPGLGVPLDCEALRRFAV